MSAEFGSDARRIFDRMQTEYIKTKDNFDQLLKSGFLDDSEYQSALSRLDESFQRVINRAEEYTPFGKIPVAPLPPMVDRRGLLGEVAFRQWNWDENGWGTLSPLFQGMREAWKPLMRADRVPSPENNNGLYARSLIPMEYYDNFVCSAGKSREAFGFVELTGHMEEHTDGVIRAECARILSLYVPINDENVHAVMAMGLLERLRDTYYPIPVYPVTSFQATLVIMREVIITCGVQCY